MNRPYRSSRSRRPKPKAADPMLMGEPSPALTKIARMNTEKLRAHIKSMITEAERLATKMDNLSKMPEPDEERIAQLKAHRQRLAALTKAAADRLEGKLERKKQRQVSGGYSRG